MSPAKGARTESATSASRVRRGVYWGGTANGCSRCSRWAQPPTITTWPSHGRRASISFVNARRSSILLGLVDNGVEHAAEDVLRLFASASGMRGYVQPHLQHVGGQHTVATNDTAEDCLRRRSLPNDRVWRFTGRARSDILPCCQACWLNSLDVDVRRNSFHETEIERIGCSKERETCRAAVQHSAELHARVASQQKPHRQFLHRFCDSLPLPEQVRTSHEAQMRGRFVQVARIA